MPVSADWSPNENSLEKGGSGVLAGVITCERPYCHIVLETEYV